MADAIAVLNAGSSSIKFSLFVMRGNELELELHGQIEGIYTTRTDGPAYPQATQLSNSVKEH